MSKFRTYSRISIVGLVCIAAFAFPFSVAVTNAALGTSLGISLVSGLLWQGIRFMWTDFRPLTLAFAALLLLAIVSLAWSLDPVLGLKKIGHIWFYLLVPLLIATVTEPRHRQAVMWALSAGLALHLLYCVLQAFDIVHPHTDGSSPDDPAGLIGHIGFGFVYGLWAGWLVHIAIRTGGWQRAVAVLLALWSMVMIFLGQGRSGYIIVVAVLLALAWKQLFRSVDVKRLILGVVLIIIAGGVAMMNSDAKDRILLSWKQVEAAQSGDLKHTEPRFGIWLAAWEAWKSSPWIGSGTGGYFKAGMAAIEKHPTYGHNHSPYSHPHNIYLLSMVRWGLLGLAMLLSLLLIWTRTGWSMDWRVTSAGCLIGMSGLAMAINGVTSSSLEEHFPGVLGMFFLGLGLAEAAHPKRLTPDPTGAPEAR